MTEGHRCEQLAQGCYAALLQWEFNPWAIDSKSNALLLCHCTILSTYWMIAIFQHRKVIALQSLTIVRIRRFSFVIITGHFNRPTNGSSVTRVYCDKVAEARITWFSLKSGKMSKTFSVMSLTAQSPGVPSTGGSKYGGVVVDLLCGQPIICSVMVVNKTGHCQMRSKMPLLTYQIQCLDIAGKMVGCPWWHEAVFYGHHHHQYISTTITTDGWLPTRTGGATHPPTLPPACLLSLIHIWRCRRRG